MAATRITSQDIKNDAIVNADINTAAAIDATKIADGSVTNAEFQYINTLGSQARGESDTGTFTNKTMTGASNAVGASYLLTPAGGIVNITGTAAAAGKVLTASSATVATWETPVGGLAVANFKWNEIPSVAPNGTETRFPLSTAASSTGVICVFKNGLIQTPGATYDYMHGSTTGIIFNAGNIPEVGDNILLNYIT